ncbi:pantoate--beta-alanine ligase [Pedobacter sp. BS3]|uniref:pantoate--beta-alanine ligase n=1 Tax=Pedobacter sp. BS3 TaxID=2567937 RepID=UPI0011EEA941|nr:pantoate--beta-alanine ligase [Pedobacter sp. BS3]TZF82034.1 pantoate--beta-alanine ligase [Pedobacter sp. BS3]
MNIATTKAALRDHLEPLRQQHKSIGFVPTMGALHQGHIALIERSQEQADVTVCSIFVNPTQFNDPEDLKKYPKPVAQDIHKLEQAGCDVLFLPSVEEMYPPGEPDWHIDLGDLETRLEGAFRPGHYQGVTQIVKKLFDVVQPDMAFFGQKDYQQILVVAEMVKQFGIPVTIVTCPTVREDNGLAMSSRNARLSDEEKQHALVLSRALFELRKDFGHKPLEWLKQRAVATINHTTGVNLEYFEICDGTTLKPVKTENHERIVALTAAFVGSTRLIDNIILK